MEDADYRLEVLERELRLLNGKYDTTEYLHPNANTISSSFSKKIRKSKYLPNSQENEEKQALLRDMLCQITEEKQAKEILRQKLKIQHVETIKLENELTNLLAANKLLSNRVEQAKTEIDYHY